MYQQLQQYKGCLYGKPLYTGIEYTREIPDNMVLASPGGISDQQHWTHGFYGDGASYWDNYAGEGNRYPYGEFGNLYQTGQNTGTDQGYYVEAPDQMFTENESTPLVENFEITQ